MHSPDQPRRVLGLGDTTAIVIGSIIGVGIFFTPSEVAAITGTGSLALVAWAVAGVIALCGALSFAELGGMYHGSGAQYAILRDACGPLAAFLYVFCNATAILAGAIGIIAVICAANLGVAVHGAPPSDAMIGLLAIGLIVVLAGANVLGVRLSARIQNVTVIAKVGGLAAVILLAAFAAPPAAAAPAVAAPSRGPLVAILAALVPAFFSYGGWQLGLAIAGEVRDPRRNLPKAIVLGMLVVIAVYVATNWAYLRLLGAESVASSKALAADAIAVVLPSIGRRAVAAAVAISALGVLNAQLLGGPRLIYALAHDGRFFSVFGKLAPSGTPAAAIVLVALMALGLLLAAGPGGLGMLLNGVVFIDGVFFVLTGVALFVLRQKRPDADRPMKVPGYPVLPAVFVLGEIGVVAGAYLSPSVRGAAWIGLLWMAAGAVLYAVRFR